MFHFLFGALQWALWRVCARVSHAVLLLLCFRAWREGLSSVCRDRGGPDYKFKKLLRLTISDTPVEDFCMAVMTRSRVHTIALKLPVNYDNKHLQRTAEERGLTYSLFTNYQKMTLTILQK